MLANDHKLDELNSELDTWNSLFSQIRHSMSSCLPSLFSGSSNLYPRPREAAGGQICDLAIGETVYQYLLLDTSWDWVEGMDTLINTMSSHLSTRLRNQVMPHRQGGCISPV